MWRRQRRVRGRANDRLSTTGVKEGQQKQIKVRGTEYRRRKNKGRRGGSRRLGEVMKRNDWWKRKGQREGDHKALTLRKERQSVSVAELEAAD